jgi:hypothetical protein
MDGPGFVPNRERAEVEPQKVVRYLLNRSHQDGAAKAEFFLRRGFSPQAPERLSEALLALVQNTAYSEVWPTDFGLHYVVEGSIMCPDGRRGHVRTVWEVRTNPPHPRLVTAFPRKERQGRGGEGV